jgi:hypothetical protein
MARLRPTDDLQAALDALAPGSVLQLAVGEYRLAGPLHFRRGVRLVGAGMAQTRLTRPRMPHAHIAEAHLPVGETLLLEDLAIAWADDGEDRQGVYLFQSDVLVVSGGRVTLRGCRLAGSAREQERSNDMYGGSGLRVAGDGEVRADSCEIGDHGGHGVVVGDRATLALANCWVTGNRGMGLLAEGEATVAAGHTAFVANARSGLAAFGGTALTLVEAAFQGNGRGGVRFDTTKAGRLAGCTIEENVGPGLEVVTGTLAIAGGTIRRNSGDGLVVAVGCRVSATDLVIEGNRGFGVTEGAGACLELASTTIFNNARGGIDRA